MCLGAHGKCLEGSAARRCLDPVVIVNVAMGAFALLTMRLCDSLCFKAVMADYR
jgi:hypothetical protein